MKYIGIVEVICECCDIHEGGVGDDIGPEEQNEDNEGRGDEGGNDKHNALQDHMRQVSCSV